MFEFLKKLFAKTDYKALVERGAIIIDVRTPHEFDGGHIKGSKNIPLDSIGKKLGEIKAKGIPVICCCASGMRSAAAKGILAKAGVEAYNGGGWMSLNGRL